MTVLELNGLPFLSLNIERIMRKLERGNPFPNFFLPFDGTEPEPPVIRVWREELERLMPEYKRLTAYISGIPDSWMRDVFERRFILRQSFRDIGAENRILGQTLKIEVYSYLYRNPEGYVSCRDLAEAWGVCIDTVNHYCRMGRFPGAKQRKGRGSDGCRTWIIPADVKCPLSLQKRTPEGYVTDRELAEAWDVPLQKVQSHCRRGLIPGAVKRPCPHGPRHQWMIPADVPCPLSLQHDPEGYVTDRELADAWGMSLRRIQRHCCRGRFPGAVKSERPYGHPYWLIPKEFMPEK